MAVLKQKYRDTPDRYGWTPARRLAQSARVRAAQLWMHSTGPKTPSGKARAAQNARKHGNRDAVMAMVSKGLRLQRLYLQMVRYNIRAARLALRSGQPARTLPPALMAQIGRQAGVMLITAVHGLDNRTA